MKSCWHGIKKSRKKKYLCIIWLKLYAVIYLAVLGVQAFNSPPGNKVVFTTSKTFTIKASVEKFDAGFGNSVKKTFWILNLYLVCENVNNMHLDCALLFSYGAHYNSINNKNNSFTVQFIFAKFLKMYSKTTAMIARNLSLKNKFNDYRTAFWCLYILQ